jgi:hypothetical protein
MKDLHFSLLMDLRTAESAMRAISSAERTHANLYAETDIAKAAVAARKAINELIQLYQAKHREDFTKENNHAN